MGLDPHDGEIAIGGRMASTFRISTSDGAGTAKTETRKKTKSGDWELEEVKTK